MSWKTAHRSSSLVPPQEERSRRTAEDPDDLLWWGEFIARLDEDIEKLDPDRIGGAGFTPSDNHEKRLAAIRGMNVLASMIRDVLRTGGSLDDLPGAVQQFLDEHKKGPEDGV